MLLTAVPYGRSVRPDLRSKGTRDSTIRKVCSVYISTHSKGLASLKHAEKRESSQLLG